jgi:rhamnose transport system ATP-binding protein
MRKNAREVLDTMHAGHIDADARLKDLGIANKHLVAVARAMSIDAQIVIMDEPTAALSMKEIEELFLLIEFLKSEGKAILFISHKFDEIYRIADRYTVFRDGEMVGEGLLKDTGQNEIVRMMVGRNVDHIFPQREPKIGAPVLSVSGLSHPTEFDDVGFELRKGEILGFAGLMGAGRTEVARAIFGIDRWDAGSVEIDGRPLPPASPTAAMAAGIALVPEDRRQQGLVMDFSIERNIALASLDTVRRGGLILRGSERSFARDWALRLRLKYGRLTNPVWTLSGGNQQKTVLAKWLGRKPTLLIVDEPTRGIDVGTKAEVHRLLSELAAQGVAILMISSELPEVLGMADRIVVLFEGRVMREFARADADEDAIMHAATGLVDEAA